MRNQAELLRDLGIIAPEPEVEVPEPSTSELVLDRLLMAVEELKVALETIPEPVVNVEAQDLSEIVTAVNGLRPGADADDIGKAVANYLKFPKPGEDKLTPTLEALVTSLEKLDFRLKGVGSQAYGGGSVTLQPGQTVGVNNFPAQYPDDYQQMEVLADQSGAGAVLTFTFSAAVHMVMVTSQGTDLVCRAATSTPTASLGQPCFDGATVYLPVQTAEVKVFAPAGTTVSVAGLRRA